jgi:hypothetical protein
MFAITCVQTGVGEAQALDWLPAYDVDVDDFVHVGFGHETVPNCIGIDDKVWPVLALIEATSLIRAHRALQSALSQLLLKQLLQLALSERIATSARMARRPLVSANENMLFEFWHRAIFSDFA